VTTRTQRNVVVAGAVAGIVIAANSSDGAYFSQSWGWVALAFLVPTTVLLILDRVSAPGPLRIALAALTGAFATWIALSTIWSISPAASGREVERVLVYVALTLAVAFVLRRGDGPSVSAGLFVGIGAVVSYGLATRLFPDRFEVRADAFNTGRLAEPLGYWNAFGMLAAVGAILAVGAVAHTRRGTFAAVSGAMAPILVVALYLSFSRGAWVALAFGLLLTTALDPRRVTVLWSFLALAPATAAGVAYASRQDALTSDDAPLADVTGEGHRLAWVVAGLIVISAASGWIAHRLARTVPVTPRMRRLGSAALAASVVAVLVAAVFSVGGPSAAVSEIRDRFEADPVTGPDLNQRLFSISGNGRAELLGVAWDAGRERPFAGNGAGTYEILWYSDRPSLQIVRDAHSLYAETFAELGLVGLVLLVSALLVPVLAAIRARRARFVAPAAGAYLAWAAASGLDWHWEMVGLTTTALLAGSVGLVAAERRRRGRLLAGTRVALVGVTATLSVLAVWNLVGNQALFAARDAVQRKEWSQARDDARRARALLFWSFEPDLALGDAYAGLGDREAALQAYRDAVETDPRNWFAWLRLARVARGAESRAAYDRVQQLNPRDEGLPRG
jgi:O-antigen ligase